MVGGEQLVLFYSGLSAIPVGVAEGVSGVDPHDRATAVLAGSALGMIPGYYLRDAEGFLWPALFAGPIVSATMISESSRDPPEDARLSFGLSPAPGRGVSAAASLRF